jgi:hypothetical protein
MNIKKFILSFLLVYILLEVLNLLTYDVILESTLISEKILLSFRPLKEITGLIWVGLVVDFIWSLFFVFFFTKYYQNKGFMEGVRYGLFIGFFWNFVAAYRNYMLFPLPATLVFEWIIYGIITNIILGISVAIVYNYQKAEPLIPVE